MAAPRAILLLFEANQGARRPSHKRSLGADAYVPSYEKGGVVWVKNDTDLPINHVAVNILTGPAPDKEPLSMATGLRLAPGETKTIEVEGKHLSPTLAYSQINAFVTFTDVDGYAWTRHPNGALTPSPWDELQMPTPLDQGRPAPM